MQEESLTHTNIKTFGPIVDIPDDYNIELKVKPTQFINNRIYINAISNLIISSIFNSENVINKHRHTLEYVLNELITNAVKYSLSDSEIKLSVLKDCNRVFFKITNYIDSPALNVFNDFLSITYNSDPQELFLTRINNLCARVHENIDRAGIGIMTLLNDYNLPLSYEINKIGNDSAKIITKFFWEELE